MCGLAMFDTTGISGLDTYTGSPSGDVLVLVGEEPSGYFADAYGVVCMRDDESSGYGPFDTYDEAIDFATSLFLGGMGEIVEVTTPDGDGVGMILDIHFA
jgi:hypothetical protein